MLHFLMAIAGQINCDECPTDCTSVLGDWEVSTCISTFQATPSEICDLYLSDVDIEGDPVGGKIDFSDPAFGDLMDSTGNAWRRLRGTGSIGCEDFTKELSCNRSKLTRRDWTMTFEIDNMSQTNYNTLASMGQCGWSGRFAFNTETVMWGDAAEAGQNCGIMGDITVKPIWESGRESCLKATMTITWSDLCWPQWVGDNPFQ